MKTFNPQKTLSWFDYPEAIAALTGISLDKIRSKIPKNKRTSRG